VLKELVEAGKIRTIIDKTYPLDRAAEAHSYYEGGQKTGYIVLTVGHSSQT
jgi:NADPH:quinone reductase-like Zn-dependent oxidoreductase